MDKIVTLLGERFLNFFTRSVAPSSIFFVLLFFNDKLFNGGRLYLQFTQFLQNSSKINEIYFYVCLVLIFLTYGYINQLFSQILDNFIKKNYCCFSNYFFEKCGDKHFYQLREKVKTKLNEKENEIFEAIEFTDYNAYQVLGKDINVGSSYVDEIKSIHALTVAIILNVIIYSFCFNYENFKIVLFLLASIASVIVFHFFAKSRYKARNQRFYINYLLKEKKDKCEKEIKIKSIKVEVDE